MTTVAAPCPGTHPGDTPSAPANSQSFARRYGWPLGIAAVLALSAGSNILVMFIAKADPAFAVEPDYYQKAVTWDATMAQERANATLGWRAAAVLSLASTEAPGHVAVSLVGADGQPITDASATVEAMHNARASQRYEAVLTPDGRGGYTAPIDAHRPGQWEIRITATRGTEHFTQSLRVDAPARVP